MTGELTKLQINNILSSQVVGRIACSDGNQPYIVPVTFAFDGEYIYGQTNEGNKLKILRKNPSVCFEVDMLIDIWNWQSVIVYGIFEELFDAEAERAKALLTRRVFPLMTSSSIHHHHERDTNGNGRLDDETRFKSVYYKIKLSKVTGRFEQQQ